MYFMSTTCGRPQEGGVGVDLMWTHEDRGGVSKTGFYCECHKMDDQLKRIVGPTWYFSTINSLVFC